MSTIIEAKDLTYKYPEAAHRALKGVSLSVEKGEKLDTLTLEEFQAVSDYFHEDIYQALYMNNCVNGRKAIGGPARVEVERQIAAIQAFLDARTKEAK